MGNPPPVISVKESTRYLWDAFFEIRHTIQSYEIPISHESIYYFMAVKCNPLSQNDISAILAMDYAFRTAAIAVSKENESLVSRMKK